MTGALPNLLVIGAAKCGTTSLHHYLGQHPDVAMSEPKELRFFLGDDWRDRVDDYRAHFDPNATVRGESTPGYTLYPTNGDVAASVHELLPQAQLVYVVRDPVERLVSHWAQTRADSRHADWDNPVEARSLEDVLGDLEAPENVAVWGSRYATQLERYLRHYDLERILVIDYADLRDRRGETLARVFGFIGVADDVNGLDLESELNTRAEKLELTRVGAPLYNRVLRPVGQRLPESVRRSVGGPLKRAVRRPVPTPPDWREWSPELRDPLFELLAPEAERLRELTGERFVSWSV